MTLTHASSSEARERDRAAARSRRLARLAPYLLILPSIVILAFALGYPLVWQFITSTQSFGLAQQFGQPPEFVGMANYVEVFTSSETWAIVIRSIAFCLINAALTVVIGVLSALLMTVVPKAVRLILQIAMLVAWAMPVVAAMTIWTWLFDWRRGFINWLLTKMGFEFTNHNWLAEPLSFYFVATVIVVWMSVPFVAFSVYAGLTQVSDEVLEAAALDGADGPRRFFHIILPLIRPVLMIVLLLQIIWDLRVFTQIKMLQDSGAPPSSTDLLGTFIYRIGVGSSDFGMASAMSIFVLVLTIAMSAFYVVQLLKEDN
ncbi:carbohydrate ABC transporter permease [Tessaracoccus caeni]|uniref:carbohydrate ABC transporter permease n=1 Tax=Tessaracoccus caeni TaxID=3031239 RepID=UPI0023D9A9C3|nr:sugar ABC transporter permease [Tessaracoccus caeni]MDF1488974.1 sugar ABC transporter permease [Tessaracoccus caeni]